MSDDFPKEFDLVVVGTGLTESIIAAAASRIGKTVLHLDQNDYYGGFWASFNLESLQAHAAKEILPNSTPIFSSETLKIFPEICHIENVDFKWNEVLPEATNEDEETVKESLKESLLKKSRFFNIDQLPTLLYSLGGMVKLLISSNICRYVEFRAIDRVATFLDGQVKTVPCSRSDVFVTNEVNVVEKRIMMKLIETCMELKEGQEEFQSHKTKTFQEFLASKRAPAKVQHYLIHALAMATPETSFEEGLKSLNKFVESLGRYGNSPFLFPMYGCGEIPQCFCRLCAVFGGIYCLQRGLKSIEGGDEGKLKVSLESSEEVSVGNVVFGPKTIRATSQEAPQRHLARAVLIVDQPLKDTNEKPKGGGVEFLRLTNDKSEAYLIQLSSYSGCCPKDVFIYHLISTTSSDVTPRTALQPFIDQIIPKEGEQSIKVHFELFFTIPILDNEFQLAEGIHVAGGPSFSLDYDKYIEEARDLFLKLYPGEEFLPRAPEPEEIIMDGYDTEDKPEATTETTEEKDEKTDKETEKESSSLPPSDQVQETPSL